MIRKLNFVLLAFMMGLTIFGVKAQATNVEGEVSEYSVDYKESIEEDSTSNCKVLISIPYSYSETIPKNPQQPVQTGDNALVMEWMVVAVASAIGMLGILTSKKEK